MTSENRLARIAGLLYLINLVCAGIATVHVLPRLIVAGDAVATATNITASEWMLHLAIAGDVVALLCEVALSALLYVLLRPVDRNLALLMAFFRLAFSAVLIANVLNLVTPLQLLAGDRYLTAFSPSQLPALAMLSLDAYGHGWTIALLFFGAHILLLGWLLYRLAALQVGVRPQGPGRLVGGRIVGLLHLQPWKSRRARRANVPAAGRILRGRGTGAVPAAAVQPRQRPTSRTPSPMTGLLSPPSHDPQVGPVLLEAVRQPPVLVHRSHPPVARCHRGDPQDTTEVTRNHPAREPGTERSTRCECSSWGPAVRSAPGSFPS